MRWPKGPPHFALNPPSLFYFGLFFIIFFVCLFCFFVLFVCFAFLFCFFVFIGGLKVQVRWPKGPPHLALNPPSCFLFGFFL